MPAWFPIVAVVVAGGWAAKQFGDTFEDASEFTKWGVVAGGLYVSYQALKSAGAIK